MKDNSNNTPPITPERREEIYFGCGFKHLWRGPGPSQYFTADPVRIAAYVDSKVREARLKTWRELIQVCEDMASGTSTEETAKAYLSVSGELKRQLALIRKDPNDETE